MTPSLFAGKSAIVFETAFRTSPTTTTGTHPLTIEVVDSASSAASVPVQDVVGSGWSKRPRRLSIAYAPLTKFTGIDFTKANSIRFVAKVGTAIGEVLLDVLRIE